MHKIVKLDVTLEIDTCFIDGKAYWRARSAKLLLEAHGQSPDESAQNFKSEMLRGTIKKFDPSVADEEAPIVEEEAPVEDEPTEEIVVPALEDEGAGESGGEGKAISELSKGELRSAAEERGVYEKGMTKAQLLEVLAEEPEEVEEEEETEEVEEEETFEGFDDE